MNSRSATYTRLQWLFALLACSVSAQFAQAQTYSVTNLGSTHTSSIGALGVNAAGQVAWYEQVGGISGAFFFDGSSTHDIGSFGGNFTAPYGVNVNASGQVVGASYTPGNATRRAFSWTRSGGIVDLGTLGGANSYAAGVNASGQVVGAALTADSQAGFRAYAWTPTTGMIDLLGSQGAGTSSYATGINASGQVVGYIFSPDTNAYRAWSWTQAGGMVNLGTLGGTYTYPTYVSDSGQVVGFSFNAARSAYSAFSWTQSGGMINLGTLGGTYSAPTGVNAAGQVVGWSLTSGNAAQHAFFWTQAGGMVDLGTLGGNQSQALGINAAGQVVGWADPAGGIYAPRRAFLWTQEGGMIDLHTRLLSAPAGMHLWEAAAISDNGSIGANGNTGAVLLRCSPVPANGCAPLPPSPPPVVGPIVASDPVAVGVQLSLSAGFTYVNATNTHTAHWTWGDTTEEYGIVSAANGSATASGTHVFSVAGIYSVGLTIASSSGGSVRTSRDVVVYDPAAGFVTGGGWFNSPLGAYKANQTLDGRATFGFVSKYQTGAMVPTGKTEFQFQAAGLRFHSSQYDWLVIAGARAQYKGTGTINGAGNYNFMLTAIDGSVKGGGGLDRFRIRIWHHDAALQVDVVDYDNQTDASAEGTMSEGTVLGGGSIAIHK